MLVKYLKSGYSIEEYKEEYDSLVNLAKTRKTSKKIYYEIHHILPRCLGGTDDDGNLIKLTAKEHIIAHILLYRIYPNDKKISRAADCMLTLVSPSTKERDLAINELDIELKSELREAASKSKNILIVCYYLVKDDLNNIIDIDIVRIFNSISSAQEEGFSVTTSIFKNNGVSGEYNWSYYSYVEENYPEALQYYLSNLPDRDLIISKRSHISRGSGKIVAYTKDFTVIREYESQSKVIDDNFTVSGVSVALNKKKIYKEYFWEYSDIFKKEHPEEYSKYDVNNLLPIVYSGTKIVCYSEGNNIVKIYNSLEETELDGFKKPYICRILKSDNKFACGYYWEYLRDWSDQEKLDEYYLSGGAKEVHKNNLYAGIRVVSIDNKTNDISIYNSLHDIPENISNYKSIAKVLQKDVNDRKYKGFSWYRVTEFIKLFPKEAKKLEKENSIELVDRETNTEIHILLTISSKLISVNELYKARVSYTTSGRAYPVLYKNPKAQKVSDEVRNQLIACDFSSYIPWLKRTKKYSISINFILKTGITRRDCANFEKIMCDDLTRFIKNNLGVDHFDDSEFYECNFVKSICPSAKNEYAYIILKESFYEDRIDLIDKPNRIFLSGSVIPSIEWRNELINLCNNDDTVSFSIYDPTIDIYDPELRSIERYRKCNTDLFVITPGDLTESMGENIINRIDKLTAFNENIFIFISILGELEHFDENELKRLEFIEKFSQRPRVYFQYHSNVSDIVNWIKNK